jgi:hypothetical protein
MRLKGIGGAAGVRSSRAVRVRKGSQRGAYCQSAEEAETIENQVDDLDPNDVEGTR